jgi:hypothetical protein
MSLLQAFRPFEGKRPNCFLLPSADLSAADAATEFVSRLALEHALIESSLPTLATQPDLTAAHAELFAEVRSRRLGLPSVALQ